MPSVTPQPASSQSESRRATWVGRTLTLHHVIETFRERVGNEEILSTLLESPLLDQEAIVRTGLDAYAKEDYITCLHVLVPQIERGLRRMLDLCHVSIYRPGPHGGFVLKNLSNILEEPAIETVFGRDFVFYARAVLTDQRAWNVRHDLAHGAMASDRMTRVVAERIIHILLILGCVRQKPDETAAEASASP